jgi:4-diphosphocytidyl-2-C-methyl-D-erythritol kinase
MSSSKPVPESWLAPAKLNLFLHVTGRREDGYHTLQTAFIFLDYADVLRFVPNESGEITRIDVKGSLAIDLPEEDLCIQAAKLLKAHCKLSQREFSTGRRSRGVSIYLQKNLPAGAGLGGGSSDAATTLMALNQIWETGLSRDELMNLGRQLGADVPVFINGKTTLALGVGDEFFPLEVPKQAYCVLIPQIHVSTAQIFSDSSLTRDTPIKTIRGSLPLLLVNDLEAVTCRLYPKVEKALKWLRNFGDARMSGTGSSVFLACDTLEDAKKVLHQRPEGVDGFVAHSLLCHPHYV